MAPRERDTVTFLVAFARPDVALLASDTRTTYRPAPDAAATGYDDAGVKIQEWGDGWLASGPSMRWRDAMLAGCAPVDAMRALETEDPELAAVVRERQLTLTVGPGERHVTAWDGSPRFANAQPHEAVALCPNGSDPAVMQRLLNAYQRTIRRRRVRDLVRATTTLYGAVYAHCGPAGTVSPVVSIGLVLPHARQLLGPFPTHQEVVHAS